MPKFPPGQSLTPARGANIKGLGIWKQSRGRQVFQKQPKSQKVARTPAEAANRATLKASTLIVPYMSAEQQLFARDVSQGTQLAVRDFLYILLFNRAFYIKRPNGQKVYSMASYTDVSQLLDVIAQTEGSLLVRNSDWWTGVPKGSLGDVLTMLTDTQIGWAAASGGGEAEPIFQVPQVNPEWPSDAYGANNFAAMWAYPQTTKTITGVRAWFNSAGSGNHAVAAIYAANPSTGGLHGGTLLAQGPSTPLTNGLVSVPLTSPYVMSANTPYYIGFALLGSGSFALAKRGAPPATSVFSQSSTTMPTTAPTTGQGNGTYASWWAY